MATPQLLEGLNRGREAQPAASLPAAAGLARSCCRELIHPQLAEVRDGSDQLYFVAVWCCQRCGRVSY